MPPVRLIHASLPLGVLLFLAVSLAVPPARTLAPGSPVPLVLIAVGATALVAALVLRSRLPVRRAAEPPGPWWQANLSRAIVVWSLIESAALGGVVGYWITRDPLLLALAAAGLVFFGLTSPARLEG